MGVDVNPIKSKEEIRIMRKGGEILGKILSEIEKMVDVGVDLWDLEERFIELCDKYDVIPACKSYQASNLPPFPTGLCISINEEAVHCYPEPGRIIEDGDLVTIDTVIKYKGYHVDSAFTVGVGEVSKEDKRLLHTTKMALDAAINQAKPGNKIGDISNAIQTIAEMSGYTVLRGYTGHGIGKSMHESPSIPCFGEKDTGPEIKVGMTLAIEPLVCEGKYKLKHSGPTGWETHMADNKNFVQVEHTVLITESGAEILTKRVDS